MAHTDKDDPWWVAAVWWEPWHVQCDSTSTGRNNWSARRRPLLACDLPSEPVVAPLNWPRFTSAVRTPRCRWIACWERDHYPGPRHEVISIYWHRPQRRIARTACRIAAGEYNADARVDTEPATDQSRHCLRWLW